MPAYLPTPREMARWDRAAVEEIGIKPEILMENAGRAACDALLECFGPLRGVRVLVMAGSGNNGGDGLVLARHLDGLGAEVLIGHTRALNEYGGEAGYNAGLVQTLAIDAFLLDKNDPDDALQRARAFAPQVVADALLGTGFSGELRPDYLRLVRMINSLGENAFVFSLDVPSGLDGRTGAVRPEAVRAGATATFEAPKTGLVAPGAGAYTGEILVCPIGIPARVKTDYPPGQMRIAADVLDLLRAPAATGHKGTFGHLLVVGGSRGLTGAPHLAALGALRAGAGLVTVACPGALSSEIKAGLADIMTLPLGHDDAWTPQAAAMLADSVPRFDALVVGPGLGRDDQAAGFLKAFLDMERPPTLLDADALYHLARNRSLWERAAVDGILTPHPKEAARLAQVTVDEVQADRIEFCRELADEFGSTVVLKGAGTVVGAPGSAVHCATIDAPNLAVAGSGDVLAGTVGAFLARGLGLVDAARAGVLLHARAGRRLARRFPCRGNFAREVADELPQAF